VAASAIAGELIAFDELRERVQNGGAAGAFARQAAA
jgi:hypothetical protein